VSGPTHLPSKRALSARGLTAIDGALALVLFLLIVQMWLLSATLEAFLAGHRGAALPAALVSLVLFAAVAAIAAFIARIDRDARGD
jgi:hypothetical protein